MKCKNHPERETADKCAGCGEGYCEDCLSRYEGKNYCAACLKAEVTFATARMAKSGAELARMKRSLIGCSVVLIGLVVAPMVLLIYPCFSLGDVGRCRANLRQVYKALEAYAEENEGWFPEVNNDLRCVLAKGYLEDREVLRCPGAKKAFSGMEEMGGSGQTLPPEMSYLFQGGLGLPEEEERGEALMWDRSPRNHRDKGINVLSTDGAVKFKTKGLSKIKLRRMETEL